MTLEELHTLLHHRWLNIEDTGHAHVEEMSINSQSMSMTYEIRFKLTCVVDHQTMMRIQNSAATFAKKEAVKTAEAEAAVVPVEIEKIPLRKIRIRKPVHQSAQPPQDPAA